MYKTRYPLTPDEEGPSVLSMDDLMFGFVICFVASGISFVFFVAEFLLWPRENKNRRRREIKKAKCAKVFPVDFEPGTKVRGYLKKNKNFEKVYEQFRVKKNVEK
jgi:hypothetical protein